MTMMHIGDDSSLVGSAPILAESAVIILNALAEGRHDREVSLAALDILSALADRPQANVTVSDCHFENKRDPA